MCNNVIMGEIISERSKMDSEFGIDLLFITYLFVFCLSVSAFGLISKFIIVWQWSHDGWDIFH